jgi:hypothetical protein
MFRKTPPKPMPVKQVNPIDLPLWHQNPANGSALRELITSDTFVLAAVSLKEAGRPSRTSLATEHENAVSHTWYAGYCDAFRDLQRLTLPTGQPETNPTLSEWNYIQDNI